MMRCSLAAALALTLGCGGGSDLTRSTATHRGSVDPMDGPSPGGGAPGASASSGSLGPNGETSFSGSAGGPLDGASTIGASCTMWITAAPSHTLQTSGGLTLLTFAVESAIDTVIAVRDPSGVVSCDDDGGGYPNPLLSIGATAGRYEIWMGTYSQGASGTYTLRVSAY
jgi:hypothetical protein